MKELYRKKGNKSLQIKNVFLNFQNNFFLNYLYTVC